MNNKKQSEENPADIVKMFNTGSFDMLENKRKHTVNSNCEQ